MIDRYTHSTNKNIKSDIWVPYLFWNIYLWYTCIWFLNVYMNFMVEFDKAYA